MHCSRKKTPSMQVIIFQQSRYTSIVDSTTGVVGDTSNTPNCFYVHEEGVVFSWRWLVTGLPTFVRFHVSWAESKVNLHFFMRIERPLAWQSCYQCWQVISCAQILRICLRQQHGCCIFGQVNTLKNERKNNKNFSRLQSQLPVSRFIFAPDLCRSVRKFFFQQNIT